MLIILNMTNHAEDSLRAFECGKTSSLVACGYSRKQFHLQLPSLTLRPRSAASSLGFNSGKLLSCAMQ